MYTLLAINSIDKARRRPSEESSSERNQLLIGLFEQRPQDDFSSGRWAGQAAIGWILAMDQVSSPSGRAEFYLQRMKWLN